MVYPPGLETLLIVGVVKAFKKARRALQRHRGQWKLKRQEELDKSLDKAVRRIQSEYDQDLKNLKAVDQDEAFSKGDAQTREQLKDLVIQLQAKVINLLEGTSSSIDELIHTSENLQNEAVNILNRQYQRLLSPSRQSVSQRPNPGRTNLTAFGGDLPGRLYAAGYRDGYHLGENYKEGRRDGFVDSLQGTSQARATILEPTQGLLEPPPVTNGGYGLVGTVGAAAFGVVTFIPSLLYKSVFGAPQGQTQAALDSSTRGPSNTFSVLGVRRQQSRAQRRASAASSTRVSAPGPYGAPSPTPPRRTPPSRSSASLHSQQWDNFATVTGRIIEEEDADSGNYGLGISSDDGDSGDDYYGDGLGGVIC